MSIERSQEWLEVARPAGPASLQMSFFFYLTDRLCCCCQFGSQVTGVPGCPFLPTCAVSGVSKTSKTESGSPAIGLTGLAPSLLLSVSCQLRLAHALHTHKSHHSHPPQTTLFPHSSQGHRRHISAKLFSPDQPCINVRPLWSRRWHWRLWICPALRGSRQHKYRAAAAAAKEEEETAAAAACKNTCCCLFLSLPPLRVALSIALRPRLQASILCRVVKVSTAFAST